MTQDVTTGWEGARKGLPTPKPQEIIDREDIA